MMTNNLVKVSTPGRICLFGEHLDYLGLPVIAAAISLRVSLSGTFREDRKIIIRLPDVQSEEIFEISDTMLPYTKPRDYFRSGLNVLLKAGLRFSRGFEISVQGNIPINSGTSSSSALLASWIGFLFKMADNPPEFDIKKIGELAYQAEVLEFGEPGGMMDQYSTAIGKVIYLESQPEISVKKLEPDFGTFVLGDSQEPKDTLSILARVKFRMLDIVKKIQETEPTFSLHSATLSEINTFQHLLTKDELLLLEGTLYNRNILHEALKLLENRVLDHQTFGKLLTEHQFYLRTAQQISTPKIDKMLQNAIDAGALGGKINGSGGGGCMFVYAPENPEQVAQAIEKAGGKAYIIRVAEGTSFGTSN